MELKVLSSNSSGNCYIISNENEAIILEAGVKFSEIKKSLNFDLSKVKGVVVSHRHGDHSVSVADFIYSGIPVLADESVFSHYGISPSIIAKHQHSYRFGRFSVKPFSVEHDVPTLGFLLNHEEMGKTVFMTDTGSIDYSFKGLNNILVEANFSNDLIEKNVMNGLIHPVHEERVKRSHLSLEKCSEWLNLMDLSEVNNIVLLHLSSQNSNADLFQDTIKNRFAKNVFIAKKGLSIPFNKTPF